MPKNRQPNYPKLQTPAMSPSHTYTVGVVTNPHFLEMEDDDICPVCDGECTCNNRPKPAPPTSGNARLAPSTSAMISPVPPQQSLKIKLTVPPNLLTKRRALGPVPMKSKNLVGMTSATANDGEIASTSTLGQPIHLQARGVQKATTPKRRGRPPKATIAAREAAKAAIRSDHHASTTVSGSSQSHLPHPRSRLEVLIPNSKKPQPKANSVTRPGVKSKGKRPIEKSNVFKKRRVAISESSASDSSDQDDFNDEDDVDDDAQSGVFPTFVSASALSTTSSNDSDSSSLSDFDSDSSIEAEEENFILTEECRARDKARVRRELLGDEGVPKMRDPQNNWVIRPRKKSVGLSDAEMEVDTDEDATEDDDDDDEKETADADDDETDERGPSVAYAGVATGWSEDEESSFDADLFFANLSDSGDSSSSGGEDGDDGDQSDLDSMSLSVSSLVAGPPPSMSFEVTHSWDGQMVFTNGLREGQGVLDVDFEVNAAQMVVDTIISASHDSDVDMTTSDVFDGEYEDVDDGLEETDGETTEEELVGPDGLPTERALRLFRLPSSISAIDPMSTMSPSVSPGPRRRRRYSQCDSPKPADILAGKVYWDESDEDSPVIGPRSAISRSRGGFPVMGTFVPAPESPLKCAIIDGTKKDIPSPFPRSRSRMRSASRHSSLSGLDQIFGGNMFGRAPSLSELNRSAFPMLSSDDIVPTSPIHPSEPIDIDDVLESSFLDSDPSSDQPLAANNSTDADPREGNKDLNRWDAIPVGAFRQARGTSSPSDAPEPSWTAETPRVTPADAFAYSNMMKTSPLSTMLWPNKGSSQAKRRNTRLDISPVILPIRDGDRTPIPPPHIPQPPPDRSHSHKTRKELRREKKLKRKSCGPAHQQLHQHHYHHHHPNLKSRASSSMQRTSFTSATSSVPPLNL